MTTTATAVTRRTSPVRKDGCRLRLFALVVAIALIPLAVTFVSLLGRHWHPASDDALEVLRIGDVGGRHTPVTGVQSRYGWDHPGPLLFWVLAPFRWVAGDTGVLAGVVIVNAAAVVGALVLARRRAGLQLTMIMAIAVLVLMRALGSTVLLEPWNPWIAVLPFLTYVMLAWSIGERDYIALPWAIAVGSFLVQTHVGYAPVVLGVAVATALLMLVRSSSEDTPRPRDARRLALVSVGVFAGLWLAPVIQQITGHPGNLGEIVRYFRHPTERAAGWSVGFGLMGRELRSPGPWLTGNDQSTLGVVAPAGTLPGLVLLAATFGAGALAWRARVPAAFRFGCLLIATAAFGIVAGTRITGGTWPYLVRWWWIIAALLSCSLLWSLSCAFAHTTIVRRSSRVFAAIALGAMVVLATVAASDATPAELPQENVSVALARLAPAMAARADRKRTYLLSWVDSHDLGGSIGPGAFLALRERGFDVKVAPALSHAFDGRHVARTPTDATLTIVAEDDVAHGWKPPDGSTEIAHVRTDSLGYAAFVGPPSS